MIGHSILWQDEYVHTTDFFRKSFDLITKMLEELRNIILLIISQHADGFKCLSGHLLLRVSMAKKNNSFFFRNIFLFITIFSFNVTLSFPFQLLIQIILLDFHFCNNYSFLLENT